VDFRPYLIRILASVKQHWLSVIPESVKLGLGGRPKNKDGDWRAW
jgi:hypothetical protein